MSIVGSNALAGASGQSTGGGGGGFRINRSLRFNSADSAYLNRTPSSAGNRKTWTWSGWLKRSGLGVLNQLFVTQSSGTAYTALYIDSSNKLRFEDYESSAQSQLFTTQVFRDVSAWQHIVVAVDTTQATASNRVKLYVNGQQVTEFDTETYMSQNRETYINNTVDTRIGGGQTANQFLNGYLAEVHFIDGQALAPTDFGEFDANNVWNPKQFEGTYNTAASFSSYPGVTISPSAIGYGNVSHVNGGGTYFYSQASSGAGSIKVEFSSPITGVTSIKYNGGGYSVNSAYNIKINGTDVFTNLSTNSSWAQASHTISSTDISSFEIYTTNDGWSLYNLLFNDVSPSGTASLGTPAGVNGFHLDFSDNSSNAALGTDSSGNSNTWTVNNISAAGSGWNQDYVWSDYWDSPMSGSTARLNGFNGQTPSRSYYANTFSTWTSPVTLTVNTQLRIRSHTYTPGLAADKQVFEVNGTNYYNLLPAYSAGTVPWVVIPETTLTSVKISGYGSGYEGSVLGGIEIDGVELVDQGIFDSNAPNIDSLIDTPTNYTAASGNNGGNYPTWNPLINSNQTFSNGNLELTTATNYIIDSATMYTPPGTGKWYWEFVQTARSGTDYTLVGMLPRDSSYVQGNSDIPQNVGGIGLYIGQNGVAYVASGAATAGTTSATFDVGDILGWAFDAENGTVKCYKNGVAQGTQFTNVRTDIGWTFCVTDYDHNTVSTYAINFGQRPFAYTPPTGYVSLCTTNLPDPTIADGSAYMDVILWTGQGNTNDRTLTTTTSADLVWTKSRSNAYHHALFDTVRGFSQNGLNTDSNNSEGAATGGYLKSVTDTSITLAATSDNSNAWYNGNAHTYVAWLWDGGDLATNSAYNQSQAWSTVASITTGSAYSGRGLDKLFNGVVNNTDPPATGFFESNGSAVTVTFSSAITATSSIKMWIASYTGYSTGELYVNGSNFDVSYVVANNTAPVLVDLGVTSLTSFGVRGSQNIRFSGLVVDGKLLVEPGIIPAGGLNSSVYNQSQVWSTAGTITNDLTSSNQGIDKAFDGSLDNSSQHYWFAQNGTTSRYTFPSVQTGTKFELYMAVSLTNTNFSVNGQQSSNVPASGLTDQWVDVTDAVTASGLGGLSYIEISYSGGQYAQYIFAIRIDNKMYIDNGVTPPTSVPTIASTVRANPSAGFSIVSYTGNGTNGATVGHGLSSAPSLILLKTRGDTQNWMVYHSALGATKAVFLSTTDSAATSSVYFSNTEPTSSVFSLGTRAGINQNSDPMIAYCFSAVDQYSAFGKFSGNSSTDGPFQYCGFKPRFLLLKGITQARDWIILDTERDAGNVGDSYLHPNTSGAENTYAIADILSNGFKMRYSGGLANQTGEDYIWAAFASHPFKTARAR